MAVWRRGHQLAEEMAEKRAPGIGEVQRAARLVAFLQDGWQTYLPCVQRVKQQANEKARLQPRDNQSQVSGLEDMSSSTPAVAF